MTIHGILRTAHQLVADGWTTGALARDARHQLVMPRSHEAVRYSILGALHAAADGDHVLGRLAERAVLRAIDPRCREALSHWNDAPGRSAAEVLALLDRASGMRHPMEAIP